MNRLLTLSMGAVCAQATCVINTLVIPPEGLTSGDIGGTICGSYDHRVEDINPKSASYQVNYPALTGFAATMEIAVGVVSVPEGVADSSCTSSTPISYKVCTPGKPCNAYGNGIVPIAGFKGVFAATNWGNGPNDPCVPCLKGICTNCRGICQKIKTGICAGCWKPSNTTGTACLPDCLDNCWKPWTIPGPGTLTYTNCDDPTPPPPSAYPPTPKTVPTPAAPVPTPAPAPTPAGGDTCVNTPCAATGLTGHCCPTLSGSYLPCCGNSAACSDHPACAALGIEGDCCPTKAGANLDCCSAVAPTPASSPTADPCAVCTGGGQCAPCQQCVSSQTGPCAPCWQKQPDGTACLPDCEQCWPATSDTNRTSVY